MNVWQKFEDSVWRKAAEQRQHKDIGGTWAVDKTDTKKIKQHKLKVKDWLFKSNLTEELLLNHPTPDDIKFFQDIRRCDIWDYFDPSDLAKLSNIEQNVILKRQSLSQRNLKFLNDCITRAQRLQNKNIKRMSIAHGKENYENYKNIVKNTYSDAK